MKMNIHCFKIKLVVSKYILRNNMIQIDYRYTSKYNPMTDDVCLGNGGAAKAWGRVQLRIWAMKHLSLYCGHHKAFLYIILIY